jgi:hypothetical protein
MTCFDEFPLGPAQVRLIGMEVKQMDEPLFSPRLHIRIMPHDMMAQALDCHGEYVEQPEDISRASQQRAQK